MERPSFEVIAFVVARLVFLVLLICDRSPCCVGSPSWFLCWLCRELGVHLAKHAPMRPARKMLTAQQHRHHVNGRSSSGSSVLLGGMVGPELGLTAASVSEGLGSLPIMT